MNVHFFFVERINFIRQLYSLASAPYIERKKMIDAGEAPFAAAHTEDCKEQPFLDEWLEAENSVQVLAYWCLSMLASTIHLYLEEKVRETAKPLTPSLEAVFTQERSIAGYRKHFQQQFNINFDTGPVSFEFLEEIVIASNRIENPPSIIEVLTRYSDSDLAKIRTPLFVSEQQLALSDTLSLDGDRIWLAPALDVSKEKLEHAIHETECFVMWLEGELPSKHVVIEIRQ